MKAADLLSRIRAQAGDVRLHPDDDSRLQFRRGRVRPVQWKIWKETLVREKYLVAAVLREERASHAWEVSGRDLAWWRTYPYSRTTVVFSCTRNALPCANVVLTPGETVWEALARMLPRSRKRKRHAAENDESRRLGPPAGVAEDRPVHNQGTIRRKYQPPG
jgi:hypothetical protein